MTRSLLISSAVATVALVAAALPANAQRRPLSDSIGMVLTVHGSLTRICYENALMRQSSDRALQECNAALETGLGRHNRIATLVNRSIVLTARGDYEAALDDLNAAYERQPNLAAIQMNFGEVYSRMSRWSDADAAFTRSLELETSTPARAHFGRAIAREESGDVEGAYADYLRATELAPTWSLPRRELERFAVFDEGEDEGGA